MGNSPSCSLDDVYGSDGEQLVKVNAVEHDDIVVKEGFFFPSTITFPSVRSALSRTAGSLNVTKSVALDLGWNVAPTIETSESASVATTETWAGTWLEPVEAGAARLAASQTVADITLEVPLYAEDLTATTTAREAGGLVSRRTWPARRRRWTYR